MKKVKAYIKAIEELDIVEGVLKLLSYKPAGNEQAVVRFPVSQMEYENEEHKFIYAKDIIDRVMHSLGFTECSWSNDYFIRNHIYIHYYKRKFEDNESYIVIERNYDLESQDAKLLEEEK